MASPPGPARRSKKQKRVTLEVAHRVVDDWTRSGGGNNGGNDDNGEPGEEQGNRTGVLLTVGKSCSMCSVSSIVCAVDLAHKMRTSSGLRVLAFKWLSSLCLRTLCSVDLATSTPAPAPTTSSLSAVPHPPPPAPLQPQGRCPPQHRRPFALVRLPSDRCSTMCMHLVGQMVA